MPNTLARGQQCGWKPRRCPFPPGPRSRRMDRPIVAVVLAGGTGTRLYPASRSHRPKQFLSLGDERSLLARTVDRAAFADAVVVSTRGAFADAVTDHAPGAEVLVEPAGRDTGPATVHAAHRLTEEYDDPVMVVLPTDHVIAGPFEETAREAAEVAADTGRLVTIGIEPERPATGYGYIEPGQERDGWVEVRQFYEKPDLSSAERFVSDGWYWNAGIFAWTAESLLREARESPLGPLLSAIERGEAAAGFEAVEAISIDYAVLERTDRAALVPSSLDWDDLGSWDAIGRNVEGPLADTVEIDAENNVIAADEAHVTAIDVSDLIIASYDDRVLVVPRESAERVGEAVSELAAEDLF